MMEAFQFLLWPLLACVVIAGIHAYLGFHVVEMRALILDDPIVARSGPIGFRSVSTSTIRPPTTSRSRRSSWAPACSRS